MTICAYHMISKNELKIFQNGFRRVSVYKGVSLLLLLLLWSFFFFFGNKKNQKVLKSFLSKDTCTREYEAKRQTSDWILFSSCQNNVNDHIICVDMHVVDMCELVEITTSVCIITYTQMLTVQWCLVNKIQTFSVMIECCYSVKRSLT